MTEKHKRIVINLHEKYVELVKSELRNLPIIDFEVKE